MFELQMSGLQLPDSSSPAVQQIQSQYGVTITFKQRPRVYVTMVIIRGSVNNAKAVKEATLHMVEQLTGSVGVGDSNCTTSQSLKLYYYRMTQTVLLLNDSYYTTSQ